ncbi:unnamed protein product, partial [Prorocentrum cordatum]
RIGGSGPASAGSAWPALPSRGKIDTAGLSVEELETLRAIGSKQGQHELAQRYQKSKKALGLSVRPKQHNPTSLHTRGSQAQSEIKQLEKRLLRELGNLDKWLNDVLDFWGHIKSLSHKLDEHEGMYKKLVIQVKGEVQAEDMADPKVAPALISLKALVTA